jgi:hypothetical protein
MATAVHKYRLRRGQGAGPQQLMAGARKFSIPEISPDDIASANRETEKETGIPVIADVQNDSAKSILIA